MIFFMMLYFFVKCLYILYDIIFYNNKFAIDVCAFVIVGYGIAT